MGVPPQLGSLLDATYFPLESGHHIEDSECIPTTIEPGEFDALRANFIKAFEEQQNDRRMILPHT